MRKTGKISAFVRKIWKRTVCAATVTAAAAVVLAASVPALPAEAAYGYQVRIQTGAQGRFKDGKSTVKEYRGKAGERISFSADEVELPKDSKYYVKGIKKSGTEEMAGGSFTIEGDADYVVVYGISDEKQVHYTVTYKDTEGNTLADPKEGWGNIGDTPIIGHLPIDGYVPQAYNLQRTLTANEADNEFPFVYTRMTPVGGGRGTETVTEETVERTETQTVIVPGADTVVGGGGGTTIVEDGGTTVIEGGGAGAAGEAGGGEEAAAGPQEPEELINLDDEETPLAGFDGGSDGPGNGSGFHLFNMPPAVIAGLVSVIVLLLAGIYFLAAKRKRKADGADKE